MKFTILNYHVSITKKPPFDIRDPFAWSKRHQAKALRHARKETSKINRIKAIRLYAKTIWGGRVGLLTAKLFIEDRFEDNGHGDLK
jgi:hypothetical protein